MFAERNLAYSFYTQLSAESNSTQLANYLKENNSQGKNYNYLTDLGEKNCHVYYHTMPVFHEHKSVIHVRRVVLNVFVIICLLCLFLIGCYVFSQCKKIRKLDSQQWMYIGTLYFCLSWMACFLEFTKSQLLAFSFLSILSNDWIDRE